MSKPENIRKTRRDLRAGPARLRLLAEAKLRTSQASQSETLSLEQAELALQELRVHKIELEMQNEELRNIQAALDISRARYFDLYNLAPVGYCTLSPRGIILEANLTAATLLGTQRSALAKSPFSRFVQKDYKDIYHFHLKRLFESGQPQVCELRVFRKSAEPFWARLESILASGENNEPVCRMTISDITDARRADEESYAQKEILDKILECAPFIMMLVDNRMRVVKINRACADFSGRSKEEVLGLLGGEVFSCRNAFDKTGCGENGQCSHCAVRRSVAHTFQTGESVHDAEGRMRIRRGPAKVDVNILISTALIQDKGHDLVLLTIADVTERTRAQEALRESEERFRELAENIRDVFWVRTSDKLLYISPAYEQIWGGSRESLYRDPASFLESVHPEYRDRVLQTFLAASEEATDLNIEFKIIRPDGAVRWICARSFPVPAGGRTIRRVGIAEDITAGREAEEFLRIEKDLAFGLGSSESLAEGMDKLLDSCLQLSELDCGGIYLVEEETGALELVSSKGLSEAFIERTAVYDPKSAQARFISRGRPGYWEKPFKGLAIADLVEREKILAFMVIPIKFGEQVVAVLYLASRNQPQISESAQATFEVIGAHIGGIISRVRLTDAVKAQSECLKEANAALKVILKQRVEDRTELEESLLKNVKHLIMPYIAKLKKSRLADEHMGLVEILESHLLEITSPFVHKISEPLLGLTPTEIRVADLIRQGKSSKEISDLLGISEYAVIFHRQGIRRKLGLTGKKLNLRTYLGTMQQV